MTDGSIKEEGRLISAGPVLVATAAVLAGITLVGVTACETIAQIPFSDRTFRDVQPVSVSPTGDSCDAAGGLATGNGVMRVVLLDNHVEPIKPGEEVSRAFVEPQQEDFNFTNGRLFSLPDVSCDGDAACGPLNCMDLDSDDPNLGDRCQRDTGVSVVTDPIFVGEEYDSQAIAIGVSEVGRWRGWYSGDFSGYHVFNDDGPNDSLRNDPISEVAVDRNELRETALSDMARDWRIFLDYVEDDGRDARFGLWTFGESQSEVISRVESQGAADSAWTSEPALANAAVNSLPNVRQGRSDIYNSIITVLNQGFRASSEVADVDKRSLVFIVAGYDERKRSTVDEVIAEAQDLDVEVSIIQVDTPREKSLLRDDWVYYEDEQPCSDDSDCANFENCREPIKYTTNSSSNDIDDVDFPREDQLDSSFCLPNYEVDEEGMARVGPVADFNRLACETGGAYTYVPTADRTLIHDPLQALVWSAEAGWEVDFSIDDYDRIDPTGDGAGKAHLLETALEVTIGRQNRFSFEHDGNRDTRRAFFTPAN